MSGSTLEQNTANLVRQTLSSNNRIKGALYGISIAFFAIFIFAILSHEVDMAWIVYVALAVYGGIIALCIIIIRNKINDISKESKLLGHSMIIRLYGLALEDVSKIDDSTIPGERIFEFLKKIFPIKTKYEGSIEGSDNYNYDMFQTTTTNISNTAKFLGVDDSVIIAKHFDDEVITREKIIEFDKNVISSVKTKSIQKRLAKSPIYERDILRVVCIGNKYDSKLDDEAYLEDVMNKTKLSQIDLLIDNNTYFEIKWLGQK